MITAADIKKANTDLESIPVKGKDYVMVNARVKAFREICPSGSISTEIISMEDGVVTMRSMIIGVMKRKYLPIILFVPRLPSHSLYP